MKRVLCLRFPHWPLQRALVARPELRGRPVALVARGARGEYVAACSRAAAAQGVRPGQPVSEALAACSFGGAPVGREGLLPYNPRADRAALGALALACERFTPWAGFAAEAREPEELLLDVTGIGPLFGGDEKLTQAVAGHFAALGYEPRVAVASTVGAAWALARYGGPGPRVVSAGETTAALAPLPVAALRLPHETLVLLGQLGIERIEQLRRLPRAGLAARFGELLARRLDQAWGEVPEPFVPQRLPPAFAAEYLPEFPLEQRAAVLQCLRQLAAELAPQLAARQQGALRLACRFDCAGSAPLMLGVGLVSPLAAAAHWAELLELALEQFSLPGAVGRLRLEVTLAARLEQRQGDLFATARQRAACHLAPLLERLSSRLGRERVLRVRLQAEAQPERVCRYEPWTGEPLSAESPARSERTTQRLAGKRPARPTPASDQAARERTAGAGERETRPLRLLSVPQPLEVLAIAPQGLPACFTLAGRAERVRRYWGPERLETGWWRGRSVRRDYYRVETNTGQRYWLFRELGRGAWFWHGTFE